MRIGGDQLLGSFYSDGQLLIRLLKTCGCLPDWHDSRQEITHLDGIVPLCIEEIQTIPLLIDVVGVPASQLGTSNSRTSSLLVSIVLQDQLLQPQESPFMRDLLPDLHTSLPCVLGC